MRLVSQILFLTAISSGALFSQTISWSALGSGVGDWVNAIAFSSSDVYVGGSFWKASGSDPRRIAKWNGNSWSPVGNNETSGGPLNGDVNTIAVSGSTVYAGGNFTTLGGSPKGIKKWDGSSWTDVGSGVNGLVYAIAVSGSDIYVGGLFTQAGGVSANNIAKWNGSSWTTLGSGVNYTVYGIAVSGGNVFVAGGFTEAGGMSVKNIAKWNGSSWSALGSGVNNAIYAMAVSGSDIYVGGLFSQAGGISVKNIAKWNGSNWSALGSGVNGTVRAITLLGSNVYVGGFFTEAGGGSANNLAKWNGSTWSALGSGTNGAVFTLAVSGSDVYVGGSFTQAGGVSSSRIAKFADGQNPLSGIVSESVPAEFRVYQNYPNPFNPSTTISFSVETPGHALVRAYDLLGREVRLLFDAEAEAGRMHQVSFDAKGLTSGTYIVRLESGGNVATQKILLLR